MSFTAPADLNRTKGNLPRSGADNEETCVRQEREDLGRRAGIAVVFGLAVLAFGGVFVVARWDELSTVLAELSWPVVLAALVLAALAQLASLASFRVVVAELGARVSPRPAGAIFAVSQLGKYLPGSVWGMVVLVSMGTRRGVPRRVSVAGGVICLVVSLATAAGLAGLLLPLVAMDTVRHFWFVALLLPLLLAALHPRVVTGVLDVALRKIGRVPVPDRMSYRATVWAAGWQTLCWLLYGLHAWVLAVGIGAPADPRSLAITVGGFALAYGIGPLFVLTPAGAGVREAVLVLLLGSVLGGSSAALAVALVSRLLLVVTEFGQAGAWTLLERADRPADRTPVPVG